MICPCRAIDQSLVRRRILAHQTLHQVPNSLRIVIHEVAAVVTDDVRLCEGIGEILRVCLCGIGLTVALLPSGLRVPFGRKADRMVADQDRLARDSVDTVEGRFLELQFVRLNRDDVNPG
jgi:hypothetical protein